MTKNSAHENDGELERMPNEISNVFGINGGSSIMAKNGDQEDEAANMLRDISNSMCKNVSSDEMASQQEPLSHSQFMQQTNELLEQMKETANEMVELRHQSDSKLYFIFQKLL